MIWQVIMTVVCWEAFRLAVKWIYWRRQRAKAQAFLNSIVMRRHKGAR